MPRNAFTPAERAAIARGDFFTTAELAAKPHLRSLAAKYAPAATGQRSDPNDRPMTAAQRREIEALIPVCFYCREPGDDRSALDDDGYHPECADAWAAEVASRKV